MKKLDDAKNFINREWSWLAFNSRVLNESKESHNPLLERLKFSAIVSSNLEEFFMVRVAALKQQHALGIKGNSPDLLTPVEQLSGIRKRVVALLKEQYSIFNKDILPAMAQQEIRILTKSQDINKHKDYLRQIFEQQLQKILTPLSVGPTHPFPNLVSGKIYLGLELEPHEDNPKVLEQGNLSFIQIPSGIMGRFVKLKDSDTYIPLEYVVKMFADKIYNGYKILSTGIFKITRDADFSIDPDAASDLLTEIEINIKRLHKRSVVRLEHQKDFSPVVLNALIRALEIGEDDIYPLPGIINLQDLFELYGKCTRPHLKDDIKDPVYPVEFADKDIFEVIREKSPVLYHPYHSYDPVVELLARAATDPDVLAIKMTLYRTSSGSEIIDALIMAAENGKYVSIVDELRARFDEERNIDVARRLENAGAHVIYGVAGLKTHAKCLLIVRKEGNEFRRYVHMATGNYNEKTAKLYTDLSYFTSDSLIGEDASTLFNLLTGFSLPNKWNKLIVAPLDLRSKLVSLINRETENARNGIKTHIIAKMNSLLDKKMVMALYEASQAGVKINLVVRGICSLKPGIPGLSENIQVNSIIGRYLEHPRIYYFYNGGAEEIYLSSADWMTRNLDRRVELLFPVEGSSQKAFIKNILDIQFKDNANSWVLGPDCNYQMINTKGKKDSFSIIYQNIKKAEQKKKSSDMQQFKPIKSID